MTEVQLIARHTMKPGTESEVLPLVQQLVDATRTIDEFDIPAREA
jgi:hypothetical protein